jgi:hypothetical protein
MELQWLPPACLHSCDWDIYVPIAPEVPGLLGVCALVLPCLGRVNGRPEEIWRARRSPRAALGGASETLIKRAAVKPDVVNGPAGTSQVERCC